jgi:crotonobetainyl-CoA:carnitine CoA-transferase CaiB-like acyl-CoA transferase
VRVVEFASFVSGPFAAMMLADLGADVVKVESPKGDPMRRFGRTEAPVSALFVSLNRGKKGMTADLKTSPGLDLARQLLATADVLVCNWRGGTADRLGLGDEALAAANGRLVRLYISGWGTQGPMADAPTFDSVVQAHLGSIDAADADAAPTITGSYVVDKAAALMAVQAVLAALFARERTGIGERIDLSLLDAAAYINFPDVMANRTILDHSPDGAPNTQAAAARAVRSADGWLVVAPVTGVQIRATCAAIAQPELADDLLAMQDGTALVRRLLDEVERATVSGSTAHWLTVFAKADVPAGPCLSIDQHLEDPQVLANDLYQTSVWPVLGEVRHVRYPAVFSTWGQLVAALPPPTPGQNEFEVEDAP